MPISLDFLGFCVWKIPYMGDFSTCEDSWIDTKTFNIKKMSCVTCHVSCVMCHLSWGHLSPVTCHISPEPTATDPPPTNFPTLQIRLVYKDRSQNWTNFKPKIRVKTFKRVDCSFAILVLCSYFQKSPALLLLVADEGDRQQTDIPT